MAQQHQENIWWVDKLYQILRLDYLSWYDFRFRRDHFMEELENEELNRKLRTLAVDDLFE